MHHLNYFFQTFKKRFQFTLVIWIISLSHPPHIFYRYHTRSIHKNLIKKRLFLFHISREIIKLKEDEEDDEAVEQRVSERWLRDMPT